MNYFGSICKKGIASTSLHRLVLNLYPRSCYRFMSANVDIDFQQAQDTLNTLKDEPGNDIKLKIYALFKQATLGENINKKPSAFNFVAQAKWNAWNSLGKMPQEEAKEQYASLINGLAQSEKSTIEEPSSDAGTNLSTYNCLKVSKEGNITTILLNRPNRKNALTREMYEEIIAALKEASEDDSVITVMTGAGDYYCSGNDLGNFANISPDQMQQIAEDSGELLRRYISAYIDFPKPLIAAVNGPAIGVSVTVLGLCDLVYATDHATFSTPFSNLGQSPEGCSTYTFPKIMGHSKACEMMLFNKKLNATEAQACGLVTAVFPASTFSSEVEKLTKEMAALPKKSLIYSKALMRDQERDVLHRVNEAECDRLVERWTSEDCMNAIMKFFSRK